MISEVRKIAKKNGIVGRFELSDRKDKKYKYMAPGSNKWIHFGQNGYEDFLIHKDEERRKRFHQRFKNNVNYNKPGTAMYLSRVLLW